MVHCLQDVVQSWKMIFGGHGKSWKFFGEKGWEPWGKCVMYLQWYSWTLICRSAILLTSCMLVANATFLHLNNLRVMCVYYAMCVRVCECLRCVCASMSQYSVFVSWILHETRWWNPRPGLKPYLEAKNRCHMLIILLGVYASETVATRLCWNNSAWPAEIALYKSNLFATKEYTTNKITIIDVTDSSSVPLLESVTRPNNKITRWKVHSVVM